jgi:hypothetical protein
MKRLLLVIGAALIWAVLSPAAVSASIWPWHHSKAKSEAKSDAKPDAAPAPAPVKKAKTHHSWFHHHAHQQNTGAPLYTSGPKSVGWFHKSPGPAGAGS